MTVDRALLLFLQILRCIFPFSRLFVIPCFGNVVCVPWVVTCLSEAIKRVGVRVLFKNEKSVLSSYGLKLICTKNMRSFIVPPLL